MADEAKREDETLKNQDNLKKSPEQTTESWLDKYPNLDDETKQKLSKFKTEDAFLKSYTELEKKFTQERQEQAPDTSFDKFWEELTKENQPEEEVKPEEQPVTPEKTESDLKTKAIIETFGTELAKVKTKLDITNIKANPQKNKFFEEHSKEILDILKNNPRFLESDEPLTDAMTFLAGKLALNKAPSTPSAEKPSPSDVNPPKEEDPYITFLKGKAQAGG